MKGIIYLAVALLMAVSCGSDESSSELNAGRCWFCKQTEDDQLAPDGECEKLFLKKPRRLTIDGESFRLRTGRVDCARNGCSVALSWKKGWFGAGESAVANFSSSALQLSGESFASGRGSCSGDRAQGALGYRDDSATKRFSIR